MNLGGWLEVRKMHWYKNGFLITPSGMKYEKLKTKDIVFVNMKGEFNKSKNKPSSEWKFHKDIYKNRNESKASK